MTVRSLHRPFDDREAQELGSPEDRLQDSSDPDTGSEEEVNSRLSPPHSPRGETLEWLWGLGPLLRCGGSGRDWEGCLLFEETSSV